MPTKNEPGKFDCYAAASSDEPMFVLRSTDPVAADLVRAWACLRSQHFNVMQEFLNRAVETARSRIPKVDAKFQEAMSCATAMDTWREQQSVNPDRKV